VHGRHCPGPNSSKWYWHLFGDHIQPVAGESFKTTLHALQTNVVPFVPLSLGRPSLKTDLHIGGEAATAPSLLRW
jgi:hypothetical protein